MKETFQTEIQSFLISKAKLRRKWRRLIPTRRWFYLYLELNQRENNESLTKVRQGFVNEVLSLKFKSKIFKNVLNVMYVCLLIEQFNILAQYPISKFKIFCQSELRSIKNMIGEFNTIWSL